MTHAIHAQLSSFCDQGVKALPSHIKDPIAQRSWIDSFIVDVMRKNWPQAVIDGLGSMDIQNVLDLNPAVPNLPTSKPTGTPGIEVITNSNIVTSTELDRQMQNNNQRLLEAMERMIKAQATTPGPSTTTPAPSSGSASDALKNILGS